MSPILEPLECPASDVASVPRRFGVGVLMILMTAFAVLFASMRTFGAAGGVYCRRCALSGVTLGQILLFQGKQPRKASLVAGGVVFPLAVFAVTVFARGRERNPWDTFGDVLCFSTGMLIVTIPGGALFGYLAGCVAAGVFLVQERFRRRSHAPLKIELLPFTPADFDTLIAWSDYSPLFELWSRGRFRYPLDHEQLAARLTVGKPEDRLCFKAVCGEMQQMVAFVELANINRESLRPASNWLSSIHRETIGTICSDALVWEIVQQAFNQQGLEWLGVKLHRSEAESLECFRKHGFYDWRRGIPVDAGEYLKLIRSNRYSARD